ncbi:MAG: hypothetical protein V7756_12630 [Halopseudomonas sp.]|uniref:hypothetical protein n=1 Tax=Halopseudomonas sp. TaxID=2901191 RepID=UPI0030016729
MIADAQFNRATLDCMTALRRQLKRSLGVTVRLGDPDAVESMIGLSRSCAEADIQQLGNRLAEMLAPTPEAEESMVAQGAIAARQYQPERKRAVPEQPVSAAPSGSVRIYRGQVIR